LKGRTQATSLEYLRLIAVARLFFDNINHLQGSWLTTGKDIGQLTLHFGADDLGSVMLEENVVSSAGARHRSNRTELIELIRGAGRIPAQRDTLYRHLVVHRDPADDPVDARVHSHFSSTALLPLVVGWRMGGPRPRTADWLGSAAIIVGLASFLALVGKPGEGHTPLARYIALTIVIVLLVGALISLSVLKRGATLRGSAYGIAAGIYFGTLGVMVDGASNVVVHQGVSGLFTSWRGGVPLIGIVALGTGGIILTQVSFQIGHLAATLPANLAADPVTAVLIGAMLLREHIPLAPGYLCGYIACIALVVAGAMRLARRAEKTVPPVDAAARMTG
jgi:hypothetical protein